MNRIEELLNELISTIYSSTNSVLSVADQITFFWGIMLLADDSPRRLRYPYKSSLNYTWESLRHEKEYAYNIIQDRILPVMKLHRSYLPKRIAKGGEKLTITPMQCARIIEILSDIYISEESWYQWGNGNDNGLVIYDHLLNQLFDESIEGEELWIQEDLVDFLASFAMSHLDYPKSIHDVNYRSGQFLTAMNTQMQNYWTKATFRLTGYSLSPVMTRIATLRLLLSGVKSFSLLNKNKISELGKPTKYISPRSKEMHDIVFIYPPSSKDSSLVWDSELPYEGVINYLRYGLSVCSDEGGWIFAMLPEEFLDNQIHELLNEIRDIAMITAIISLPKSKKSMRYNNKNILMTIQIRPTEGIQDINKIKRYSISDLTNSQVSAFVNGYNNENRTVTETPISPEISEGRSLRINELILSSISNYENDNLQDSLTRSSHKIIEWYNYLDSLGNVAEVTDAIQMLIRDQCIEAVITEEGQVFFRLKQHNSNNNNRDIRLQEVLSLEQWNLYQVFCSSKAPLAVHKARQSLSNEDQIKLTIQHALDTVYLLSRLGYLERIDELLDEDNYSFIDTWTIVPEGERKWKFTV